MAHVTDQSGNPIQLTDEFGNPVTLTDEHGNPVHLSGVAYAADAPVQGGHGAVGGAHMSGTTLGGILSEPASRTPAEGGVGGAGPVEGMGVGHSLPQPPSGTSSSNSSEEEVREVGEAEFAEGVERGTRRRRKKKGITEKIKEKLSLSGSPKAKDEAGYQTTTVTASPAAAGPHKVAVVESITQKTTTEHVEKEKGGAFVATDTTTTSMTTEHRDQAKKGVFEKIMDKLPGHHSTH